MNFHVQTAHISALDLEAQSRTLDKQILKLDRRGAHITPQEHERAVLLKKLRLATKDRLSDLRR